MRAGRLDRRVTIQSRSLASDAQGQQIESWTDVATVWGRRLDLRGREFMAAEAKHAEATCTFELRYRADVTPLNRLVCEGRVYNIVHVAEIGRRQSLQIVASARVP
jgi:SPP1 family predicted phage head-tail adaptor